jgi:hypothetical protein
MKKNLREIKIIEHELIYCPIIKESINPCKCYETRMGMSNILESAGIKNENAWKVCQETCKSIPTFVEKSNSIAYINERGKIIDNDEIINEENTNETQN